MLAVFPDLRLSLGWVLQAYQYQTGGNGFVFTLPDDWRLVPPSSLAAAGDN